MSFVFRIALLRTWNVNLQLVFFGWPTTGLQPVWNSYNQLKIKVCNRANPNSIEKLDNSSK